MVDNGAISEQERGETFRWEGNLRDDCTAVAHGLMLRAEMMDRGRWWWAVYRGKDEFGKQFTYGEQVVASYDVPPYHAKTGKEARAMAESAARDHLETRRD